MLIASRAVDVNRIVSGLLTVLFIYLLLSYLLPRSKLPVVLSLFVALSTMNFSDLLLKFVRPSVPPERQSLLNAIAALENYSIEAKSWLITRRRKLYSRLPLKHRRLATQIGYPSRIDRVEEKIGENAKLLSDIASLAKQRHRVSAHEMRFAVADSYSSTVELIEHFVRDWSDNPDRKELFRPVLKELQEHVPLPPKTDGKVLIPGAGLCRLGLETTKLGYTTTTIEMSSLMKLATDFIFDPDQFSHKQHIYPYIHEYSHQRSAANQIRPVSIPDIAVGETRLAHTLYGDFLHHDPGAPYDAIVTLYFIDTAQNIFDYIAKIYDLLSPGGIWINYGPLKWGTMPGAELSLEEIKSLLRSDWKILSEFDGSNSYNPDPEALWEAHYKIQGWCCQKL
ncbi:hypothetical protein TRVA0_003S03224 [Trichomonascus vanleenenianus]|uniref:uncharacterized protein n=1 Tax=Trichomonascus vanleenenianus TaxID=2268995 RepID=UPI003EC9B8F5